MFLVSASGVVEYWSCNVKIIVCNRPCRYNIALGKTINYFNSKVTLKQISKIQILIFSSRNAGHYEQ